MTNNFSGPLILNEGVLIIPVADLPDESRTQIEYESGDFAVSRLQSRNGSKIIDANSADLLARFHQQRTIVEAVILFARAKDLEPNKVLEGAYPFFRNMIDGGFLVPSGSASGERGAQLARGQLVVGSRVLGASVRRTLHTIEDTEIFLLSRENGAFSVLKIERLSPHDEIPGPVRARLSHEAAFLERLRDGLAPKLLDQGELDGRSYLELEFIEGVDVMTASFEWRERGGAAAQGTLLTLAQSIAQTYATLHERGVLHGDVHPSNVLLRRDGTVVLIDFGVARGVTAERSLPTPPDRGGMPFFFRARNGPRRHRRSAFSSRFGC